MDGQVLYGLAKSKIWLSVFFSCLQSLKMDNTPCMLSAARFGYVLGDCQGCPWIHYVDIRIMFLSFQVIVLFIR